jgi:hypothetical protein
MYHLQHFHHYNVQESTGFVLMLEIDIYLAPASAIASKRSQISE